MATVETVMYSFTIFWCSWLLWLWWPQRKTARAERKRLAVERERQVYIFFLPSFGILAFVILFITSDLLIQILPWLGWEVTNNGYLFLLSGLIGFLISYLWEGVCYLPVPVLRQFQLERKRTLKRKGKKWRKPRR